MWLVIYREHPKIKPELAGRVFAAESARPPEGAYPLDKFEVKEWDGPPPSLGDPGAGILPDPDPTLDDPDYQDKVQQRLDFEALAEQAGAEIEWLEQAIPTIADPVARRVAQENLRCIKAWRYVLRRLA